MIDLNYKIITNYLLLNKKLFVQIDKKALIDGDKHESIE